MRQKQSGMTIIESIVTIAVLAIVVIGISTLFIVVRNVQADTAHLESATRAAERQVESLRNNNFSVLEPGVDIDFTDELPDDLPADKNGTVVVSEPTPDLRRVDVTVSYTHAGRQRQVEVSSIIGVIGITQ